MKYALKELYEILDFPKEHQRDAMECWVNRWIIKINSKQLIMDKKYMTANYADFIKQSMCNSVNEVIIEHVADFDIYDKCYEVEISAIRRKPNEK